MFPAFFIPLDYYTATSPRPIYQVEWVKKQHERGNDIIYDERLYDAIEMVSDGRAELLVANGYNMYGERIRVGRNFFDQRLDEDYGMYDLVPRWVKNCKSNTYYEIKKGVYMSGGAF